MRNDPPVKEIFVEDWIIVCESLGQAGESRGRDLLQGGLPDSDMSIEQSAEKKARPVEICGG